MSLSCGYQQRHHNRSYSQWSHLPVWSKESRNGPVNLDPVPTINWKLGLLWSEKTLKKADSNLNKLKSLLRPDWTGALRAPGSIILETSRSRHLFSFLLRYFLYWHLYIAANHCSHNFRYSKGFVFFSNIGDAQYTVLLAISTTLPM